MKEKTIRLLNLFITFAIIIVLLILCYKVGYRNGLIAGIPKEIIDCCTKNQQALFWVNLS